MMNDAEIEQLWSMLEPNAWRRGRIENRVFEWVEASETSLLTEWLELIKLNPLGGVGLVAASALSLLALTPLGWLASSLLR
jgi:hypothetical protein